MKLEKETRILIVGLGLLGGSYAMCLKKQGYSVKAISKNQEDIDYAMENGIIDYGTTAIEQDLLDESDLIIFALYPHTFLEWIRENGQKIKKGTVLTDVTGVKGCIVYEIQDLLPEGVEFIAAHPMAGKESSGIKNSDDSIFKTANYIVVPTAKNTPMAINMCYDLGQTLGFNDISQLNPEMHDEMIAFLSQLTHCIAVSLMCANDNSAMLRYTGDSFRDLTRIAKINDEMWSELFLLNKDALLREMDSYKQSFERLYEFIKSGDTEGMREMMRYSTMRREKFEKKE